MGTRQHFCTFLFDFSKIIGVDCVLSDMAPNARGIPSSDHNHIISLCRALFHLATQMDVGEGKVGILKTGVFLFVSLFIFSFGWNICVQSMGWRFACANEN